MTGSVDAAWLEAGRSRARRRPSSAAWLEARAVEAVTAAAEARPGPSARPKPFPDSTKDTVLVERVARMEGILDGYRRRQALVLMAALAGGVMLFGLAICALMGVERLRVQLSALPGSLAESVGAANRTLADVLMAGFQTLSSPPPVSLLPPTWSPEPGSVEP